MISAVADAPDGRGDAYLQSRFASPGVVARIARSVSWVAHVLRRRLRGLDQPPRDPLAHGRVTLAIQLAIALLILHARRVWLFGQ